MVKPKPRITRVDEEEPVHDEPDAEVARRRPFYKRRGVIIIAVVVLLLGTIFGVRYWLYARSHESTDDAFIDGHIIQVSPKASGYVSKIYVTDNQQVKEGDLIAELVARVSDTFVFASFSFASPASRAAFACCKRTS